MTTKYKYRDGLESSHSSIAARALFLIVLAFSTGSLAQAQAVWKPERAVQLVVPYPPGGAADALARMLVPGLSAALGQQLIVDNRPGAGATIGTEYVARAAPDGHTLLMVTAPNAIGVTLYPKLRFNLLADFTPVAPVAATQFMLVVNASTGISSLADLINTARKRPGQLNFGSSGNGTVPHLALELIKSSAGVNLTHVPYKGAAPAVADLLANVVQVMAIDISLVLPHVRAGRLHGIAVTGKSRAQVVPEIPTVSEAGLKGYEILSWFGVLAPANTPAMAVERLNAEIGAVVNGADFRSRLTAQGTDPMTSSSREFGDFLREEVNKFAKLVKASGAKVD